MSGITELTPKGPSSFWNTLQRIQLTLGFNDSEIAEYLEIALPEFERLKRSRKAITITAALSLSERLHIGVEALFNGQIDYTVLGLHQRGDDHMLPERYSVKAMSRMRSVKTFLSYVESRYGWQTRALLLRRFQIKEAALMDDNSLVNVRLSSDICNFIHRYAGDLTPIVQMGQHSFHTYSQSRVGALIKTQTKMRDLHEFVVTEILGKYIEANFIWQIDSISDEGCTVSGTPNPDCPEVEAMHSPLMCVMRSGFTSAVPRFLGFDYSQVRKSACVWHGDPCCRYEIRFPRAKVAAHARPLSPHSLRPVAPSTH